MGDAPGFLEVAPEAVLGVAVVLEEAAAVSGAAVVVGLEAVVQRVVGNSTRRISDSI